jgi:hypothetical protein
MSDESPTISTTQLNGHPMRSVRIDDTEFVSLQDFGTYLHRLVTRIGDLSHWQAEHLTRMNETLDVLCDVISRRDPELREALRQAAQRRAHPA